MKIIKFFESDKKEHWISEIHRSGWSSGEILIEMINDGSLQKICGDNVEIILLTEGDELISYCTIADQDDVDDPSLSGWTGFVFTFPEHRGKHLAGELLKATEEIARGWGKTDMYISTDHIGLYEKYGYHFMEPRQDIYGNTIRVYTKKL